MFFVVFLVIIAYKPSKEIYWACKKVLSNVCLAVSDKDVENCLLATPVLDVRIQTKSVLEKATKFLYPSVNIVGSDDEFKKTAR